MYRNFLSFSASLRLCGKLSSNQKGVSIIAVVATMLILSVMGVALISLVITGSDISINQLQSEQALNIAEGGKEFVLANRSFPNYSMQGATAALGAGSFSVSTPAYLTAAVAVGNININVNSTAGFAAAPGRLVIDSEVMTYIAMTPTTFTVVPATSAHANGNAVYPVATLTADPGVGGTTLNVFSSTGFVVPGAVKIDNEYIYCSGATAATFTGCIRGYRNTIPAAHPAGRSVFQYIINSTATAGTAQRTIRANIDRGGAITYFGSASNPADNGGLGTPPPVDVTPPASMLAGDLAVMIANTRVAGITPAISATGGQAWTSENAVSINGSMRLFWCRYNGAWTANPSVSFGTSANTTVVMHVFRPAVGSSSWALDVAQVPWTFVAPPPPRDVTIAGIATVTNGALVLFVWSSRDNNTWGLQTAGWTNAGGPQYRNQGGADGSQSAAYMIMPTAGLAGPVTNRELTNGGGPYDPGNTISIAFREVAAFSPVIDWQELY